MLNIGQVGYYDFFSSKKWSGQEFVNVWIWYGGESLLICVDKNDNNVMFMSTYDVFEVDELIVE